MTLFASVTSSAALPDQTWAGPAWEQDDYDPGTTLHGVHTSCHSTVGVATLIHQQGVWRFATVNDDCVGFDSRYPDADCSTDTEGVLTCSTVAAPPGISDTMTFTPAGHVTVDYYTAGSFAGGHYHIEGDLSQF